MRSWWLPFLVAFIRFIEFVVRSLRSHGGSGDFDQSTLALIHQPIPQPHDQGKIRVFDVGCGQGVSKDSLMRRFGLIMTRLTIE